MNNWALSGWFAGIFLAYGIGSAVAPDLGPVNVISILIGAALLGAILGKLASAHT